MDKKETIRFGIKKITDSLYYTHGYPGSFNLFPKLQIYQSKSAASKQCNKLKDCIVVQILLKEI